VDSPNPWLLVSCAKPVKEAPVVIIACRVLQGIIEPRLERAVRGLIFLDYGLHRSPRIMAESIQKHVDSFQEPCLILIGYGLCGNGLVGVKSRIHTLAIPRTDDCIALLLGSYASYLAETAADPGTYFLTRGWLESGSEPLSEYREYILKYGPEKAALIMDAQYRNYRRLCLVGYTEADLAACRARALEVAGFCRERWGWRFEERIGSDALIRQLLGFRAGQETEAADLVVIPPGAEVEQSHFLRR